MKNEILHCVQNDKGEAVVLFAHSGTSTKSRRESIQCRLTMVQLEGTSSRKS
jgi:hypothetical protein